MQEKTKEKNLLIQNALVQKTPLSHSVTIYMGNIQKKHERSLLVLGRRMTIS